VSAARQAPVVAAVPAGTRLVHIGPHKTGTTAVQNALWDARWSLLEQGVHLAGKSRHPSKDVRAVAEQSSPYDVDKPPSMRHWRDLVNDIRGTHESRVIVSSEFFAWACREQIERIVRDLDADRIRVVVTLRPLVRVMPSMWQQNVQQGRTVAFEDWVRDVLADPKRPFWTLERHDALVERWVAVVGRDRVTGVVVDDADHGAVMRSFEDLLGLRRGTLIPERDLMNRSLTMAEAEAVRAFNIGFKASGLPLDLHTRTMRFGAAQLMKRRIPPPDEAPVALPGWAYPDVARIQRDVVAGIKASGIAIVGDLQLLEAAPPAPASDRGPVVAIPPEVVGAMGMGLLAATGASRQASVTKGPFKYAEPAEITRVPTYQLFGALGLRAWRATVGRIGSLRSRGKVIEDQGSLGSLAAQGPAASAERMRDTDSETGMTDVSRTMSASDGASYGESMPVKSGISPARARR